MVPAMNAEDHAAAVLEKLQVEQPPVPIDLLAEQLGAQISYTPSTGPESGFALRSAQNDGWVIGVNSNTSRRRQRFTVAHEIGHLLMHEGRELIVDQSVRVNWRDDVSSMATDREEIEANRFAAAILMPRRMVIDAIKERPKAGNESRDELIASLARMFDVSTEAMGYRLINLGILSA